MLGRERLHVANRDRHLDRLQRVDDRTQLVPAAAAIGPAGRRLTIGADELPRLLSEQSPGALGLPIEGDAVAREPSRRDLANDRAQAVVEVERRRLGEIQRARDGFELPDPLSTAAAAASGAGSARGSAFATPSRTAASARAATTNR